MKAWLLNNQKKAKSYRDWPRFINGWMARNAGKYQRGEFKPEKESPGERVQRLLDEEREKQKKKEIK